MSNIPDFPEWQPQSDTNSNIPNPISNKPTTDPRPGALASLHLISKLLMDAKHPNATTSEVLSALSFLEVLKKSLQDQIKQSQPIPEGPKGSNE